jgi:TolB protein
VLLMPRSVQRLVLLSSTGLLAALAACQATPPPVQPRSAWPAESGVHDPLAGVAPLPLAFPFHGDDPSFDLVPFENRLVSSIIQHTFTTDGGDFDPDVSADGRSLVYASTRNSLRADVYMKSVDGTAVTQITSDPADDIQPRLSPDGRQIAFCSNRAGNWDIWVVGRDGTDLRQLTQDLNDEVAPCWSPDGTELAFTLWNRQARRWEIWALSVDQPGVRRFLTNGMFPAWSPDGRHIAFQRARQRGTRWYSIWTVELVDGEARYPTEIAWNSSAACIAPRWSPDGTQVAYCTVSSIPSITPDNPPATRADVWITAIADGQRVRLTDGASPAFNPTWASDGRVYFVSARQGADNIWSVSAGSADATATKHADSPQVSAVPPVPGATETE